MPRLEVGDLEGGDILRRHVDREVVITPLLSHPDKKKTVTSVHVKTYMYLLMYLD